MLEMKTQLTMQGVALTLLVADVLVYQLFYYWLPDILAKYTSVKFQRKRLMGCIGVLIFSVGAAFYMRSNFVNEAMVASLEPFQRGRYIGQIVGTPVAPALIVIIVSAVKSWRERKSFNANKST